MGVEGFFFLEFVRWGDIQVFLLFMKLGNEKRTVLKEM